MKGVWADFANLIKMPSTSQPHQARKTRRIDPWTRQQELSLWQEPDLDCDGMTLSCKILTSVCESLISSCVMNMCPGETFSMETSHA